MTLALTSVTTKITPKETFKVLVSIVLFPSPYLHNEDLTHFTLLHEGNDSVLSFVNIYGSL